MLEIERIANNIRVSEERENDFKSKYVIEPLYRGYGNTLGNAIRRVMLSSIPGAAIKGIKVNNILSEFLTIEGVKEAVTDIVLNVKEIVVKTDVPGEKKMTLSVRGPKEVTAADIRTDSTVQVVNPEKVIATVTADMDFDMEFLVDTGEGFVVSEEVNKDGWEVGYIAVDAIYTPIKKVNYKIEDTMVGRITNYDKLTLDVETNGSVNVRDAISYSIDLLLKHLTPILEIGNKMENMRETVEEEKEEKETTSTKEKDVANIKIDELDLTVRSYNCLKKAGIENLGQLSEMGVPELLKIKNLGRKSLTEIIEKLKEYGFELNSDVVMNEE